MSARAAIYLDANAGAPLHPQVREALLSFLGEPHQASLNPSSIHSHGRSAKRLIQSAREAVLASLTSPSSSSLTRADQILFTSSGTEANQHVIRSVFEPLLKQGKRPHWLTTRVEHASVLELTDWLKEQGGEISYLPVDENGLPRESLLRESLRPETALVSVLWVNNETGAVADARSFAAALRDANGSRQARALLHLDAAQAWGKTEIDLAELGADFLTFSGHKIGALPGTGVLWAGNPKVLQPLIHGSQEKSQRGGTENVLGILSLGVAARALEPRQWDRRVRPLRDRLEREILERVPGAIVNAASAPRVANTVSVSFDGLEGAGLVQALDLAGFSVSVGSACASGSAEPSHVLLALGRSEAQAKASLRISLVNELPWEELERFLAALVTAVGRMRNVRKLGA